MLNDSSLMMMVAEWLIVGKIEDTERIRIGKQIMKESAMKIDASEEVRGTT